jgi:hypothetical protein
MDFASFHFQLHRVAYRLRCRKYDGTAHDLAPSELSARDLENAGRGYYKAEFP